MSSVRKFLHRVKGNARAIRKAIRDSRETALVAAGLLTRRFAGVDAALPLGEWRPFEVRRFDRNAVAAVDVVTPGDGHYMHTFFDVDPISPSGRYLLLTRVPFIWRVPTLGDVCQVCIVDLELRRCMAIYESRGWGTQLGANAQWGPDDKTVFCNDVVDGRGTGVRINVETLLTTQLDGAIYGLSPDKRYSYSGSIDLINLSQTGYGVPERLFAKVEPGSAHEAREGVWRTDLVTGRAELILSLTAIREALPDQGELTTGDYFVQNVKVSPANDRLLIVVFSRNVRGRLGWPTQLLTCDIDGCNINVAVHDRLYRKGGHHPNWHPTERRLVMNLRPDGRNMRFYSFRGDGTELRRLDENAPGGGHPSIRGQRLLTDAYVTEGFSDRMGRVPIRLLDLETGHEVEVCRIFTKNLTGGRRVDPHPVWSKDGRIVFNGVVDGRRQVFIASLQDPVQ